MDHSGASPAFRERSLSNIKNRRAPENKGFIMDRISFIFSLASYYLNSNSSRSSSVSPNGNRTSFTTKQGMDYRINVIHY